MKNLFVRQQTQTVQTTSTGFGWETKVIRIVASPQRRRIESNPNPQAVSRKIILLVSDDGRFIHDLRTAAKAEGHLVIQVESLSDALRTVRTNCAHTAVLDLDLNGEMAWDAADCLLQTPKCPPVVLTTGRAEQFDMKMAVNAGAILDKTSEPSRILSTIDKILKAPQPELAERNQIQRVMIRWLRPLHWPMPSIRAHRWWEFNEK